MFPSCSSLQRVCEDVQLKFIRVKMNNDGVDLAATVKGKRGGVMGDDTKGGINDRKVVCALTLKDISRRITNHHLVINPIV